MTTVSVRYIIENVDATVDFYAERLGFNGEMRPGTGSCSRTPRTTRSSSSSPPAPEHWSFEPGL
jgi:catechol 2,3-dioxygenase-like lactoylglutathione lyase family enzyme